MFLYWGFHSLLVMLGLGEPLAQAPGTPPMKPEAPPSKPGDTIQQLPLPPNSVIVIPQDAGQALQLMKPAGVILSPEQYKAILERTQALEQRIAELEKKAAPRRDAVMSQCLLTGEVSGEVLSLKVELTFRTTAENQLVPVGLRGLRFLSAKLDGETPAWGPDLERPAIVAKEARVYQLVLEVQTRVSRQGDERNVLLELPPAAITRLELSFAERIRNASLRGRTDAVPIEHSEPRGSRIVTNLPMQSQLDLTWQTGSSAATATNRVAVTGDIRIVLDEKTAETEALLLIECRQATVSSLPLKLAERGSDLSVLEVEEMREPGREAQPRSERVSWRYDAAARLLHLTLDPPLTTRDKPLGLRIRTRQALPKAGARFALGQFALQVPPSQTAERGIITVSSGPGLQTRLYEKDLSVINSRDVPPRLTGVEAEAVAAYRYWRQPVVLEAQIEPLQPVVEARANHQVHVTNAVLQARSDFVLEITRAGIHELEVRWPRELTLDRVSPASLIEQAEVDSTTGILRIRFIRRQQGTLRLHVEGSMVSGEKGEARLDVPLPLCARRAPGEKESVPVFAAGGDELRLTLAEDLEVRLGEETAGVLSAGGRPADPAAVLRESASLTVQTSDASTRPPRLALRWQPRRWEVRSDAEVWMTRRALKVRQTLSYAFGGAAPGRIAIRVPRSIDAALRAKGLSDRRRPVGDETVERSITLPRVAGEYRLVLEWQTPLPEPTDDTPLTIALVQPADGISARSFARIWAASCVLLKEVPDSGWLRQVSDASMTLQRAPDLCLARGEAEAPLRVARRLETNSEAVDWIAERILIETRLTSERLIGRACFRLPVVRSDEIVLRWSTPSAGLEVERTILHPIPAGGGAETAPPASFEPATILEEDAAARETRMRVPIEPFLLDGGLVLEVRYQLALSRGAIENTVPAPDLKGRATIGQVRWRIELPAGQIPLWNRESYVPEQSWRWQPWLVSPQPALLAREVKDWIGVPSAGLAGDERPGWSYYGFAELSSLHLFHMPQRSWLIGCSLLALMIGLALFLFAGRRILWVILILGGLGVLGVANPSLLRVVFYGAQPGVVVLGLIVVILWIRRQRWRRQLVLLPGFTRVKVGSSLVRGPTIRKSGEPSTIEAAKPARPASSELRA